MRISRIFVYPVKSFAAIEVDAASIDPSGLSGDRRLMVVDPEGRFVSQREIPGLATVIPEYAEGRITLRHRNSERELVISDSQLSTGIGNEFEVEVWGRNCGAHDIGHESSSWISEIFGRDLRLVAMSRTNERRFNPAFGEGTVSFADDFPILIASESSLEELNRRTDHTIPMSRFRPNLVLEGSSPFAEDEWKRIRIGEAEFRVTRSCARCVMTTIDQASGRSAGKDPLRTLATFRKASQVFPTSYSNYGFGPNDVLFGQNLVPETPGRILTVGDEVEVID